MISLLSRAITRASSGRRRGACIGRYSRAELHMGSSLETICLAHYRLPPRTRAIPLSAPLPLLPPPSTAALREPCKITSTATVSSPIIHEEFEITFFSNSSHSPSSILLVHGLFVRIGRRSSDIRSRFSNHRTIYPFSFQSARYRCWFLFLWNFFKKGLKFISFFFFFIKSSFECI